MSIPASITIIDLPMGTTIRGPDVFEAVQTGSDGFARSVQITASQIAALARGPSGGGRISRAG